MVRFSRDELIEFFKSIDRELAKPFELYLIGGTAAALAYKVTRATRDIDVIRSYEDLKVAYKKAEKSLGIKVPLEQVSVYDGPYNFEDRLKVFKGIKLNRLKIFVPEIHDLILMKTLRGYAHDFEAIEEMIEKNKVSKKIIEERIKNEMDHVIGDKNNLELNFEALRELL